MVSIKGLFAGALFAAVAIAQAPTTNFSQADINSVASGQGPDSPDAGTKVSWCKSQQALCGTLCSGNNQDNHCDSTNLTWSCKCSNGSTPGLQYYPYSIIGNECHTLNGNCKVAHQNDAASQAQCDKTYVCGNATEQDAMNAANAATAQSTMSTQTSTAAAATGSASPTHNAAVRYGPGVAAIAILGALGAAL